jgi:membrane-bound lytic murein transglycosylase B
VFVDPDGAPCRPLWPWLLALVLLVGGGGAFVVQAQAMALDVERSAARVDHWPAASGATDATAPALSAAADGSTASTSGSAPVADAAVPGVTSLPAEAASIVRPDPAWTGTVAVRTGIPERALRAYATAALTLRAEQPDCGLGWNTLAGLGAIESAHGAHGGGSLRADGYPDPPIRGIPLDGTASAAIPDTDGGRFDGDAVWDRAVGPLQFIPATWQRWGADANGDGVADPNQIDDAALAAGRYLCAAGEMTSPAGWRRAVFSYNHLDTYVDDVAAAANGYAARAGG